MLPPHDVVLAADGTPLAVHRHVHSELGRDAPVVVLSNGIFTTENFWRHLWSELTADHHVFHWDYRGHARTPVAVSGDYRMQTLADDLARVSRFAMEAVGTTRPPLQVGFSMGVVVVLELYRRSPELVRAMALVAGPAAGPFKDVGPFRLPGVRRALLGAMKMLDPVLPRVRTPLGALLRSPFWFPAARMTGVLRSRAPRDDVDTLLHAIARMDPTAYWDLAQKLLAADASDVCPTVEVPSLIVTASHDVMAPRSQTDRLRAAMPRARHIEVQDAGHAGLVEAGPEIAQAIRELSDGLGK